LWYSSLLAGVLIVFGSAVFLLVSYSMTIQVDDQLLTTAEDIRSSSMRDISGVIGFPPLALDLTANVMVQLLGPNGEMIAERPPMFGEVFDQGSLAVETYTITTVPIEGSSYRVLTYPLVVQPEDQIVGYLQLATSLDTAERILENLIFFMVIVGVLAVIVAAIIGWTTALTALRPLDQVTETALQITRADDLSRRIPYKGPLTDEVGRLVIAFNSTLERLENLFETQRRFLADVSHELRTPLTAIRGNVDLIRRMEEADQESLNAITSEVDRMTRMVQDLLLLAQAETGKLPLAQDVIELDTLMLDVYKQAKVLAPNGVQVRIGREDQVQVIGDADRLRQVLLNLVTNALQHTPSGGSVTLGLARIEEWARLSVSDTGPGIPQEELPHIFERFYRIESSRSRTSYNGGTGLGLSISYWITRSHKGRLEVASQPGEGTTFLVWLPRHAEGELEVTRPTEIVFKQTETD
jgi:signal transduction histidine kinase